MREDANSPAQIVLLTPAARRGADGLSVTQRDCLLLDAALYFGSGLLLYFQHVSNDKNSLMKSGLSHKWGKEGEEMRFYSSIWAEAASPLLGACVVCRVQSSQDAECMGRVWFTW